MLQLNCYLFLLVQFVFQKQGLFFKFVVVDPNPIDNFFEWQNLSNFSLLAFFKSFNFLFKLFSYFLRVLDTRFRIQSLLKIFF